MYMRLFARVILVSLASFGCQYHYSIWTVIADCLQYCQLFGLVVRAYCGQSWVFSSKTSHFVYCKPQNIVPTFGSFLLPTVNKHTVSRWFFLLFCKLFAASILDVSNSWNLGKPIDKLLKISWILLDVSQL